MLTFIKDGTASKLTALITLYGDDKMTIDFTRQTKKKHLHM